MPDNSRYTVDRDLPDEALIERFRQSGDSAYVGALFTRYSGLVFGTCMKYLKHAQDSEDASMVIFESLMDKLKAHEVEQFRPWLYVMTRNHCLQILRRKKKTLTKDLDDALVHLSDPLHPDDVELLEHRENGLKDCLGKLPGKQKQAIELFYYQSKSYLEIAEILEEPKDKVRSYIQNGRRNLKLCMDKHEVRTIK